MIGGGNEKTVAGYEADATSDMGLRCYRGGEGGGTPTGAYNT